MKNFHLCVLGPVLFGLAVGALFGAKPAHACSCSDSHAWQLELEGVSSNVADTHPENHWPASGKLFSNRLELTDMSGQGQKFFYLELTR